MTCAFQQQAKQHQPVGKKFLITEKSLATVLRVLKGEMIEQSHFCHVGLQLSTLKFTSHFLIKAISF